MKIYQTVLPILVSFLVGCNSVASPESIQIEPIQTLSTESTSTNTPSPEATLEPSILENYLHVFAYADGNELIFLDENANRITTITNNSGWIVDFKVSPDANYVIYSPSNENALLNIQKIGQKKIIQFSHQSKKIIYFDWLSNENFVVLTNDGYFIGSLDGSKTEINSNIIFSQPADTRSFYSTIKSPSENNLLVLQSISSTEDGKISGCAVYFIKHETGELKELVKEDNYCYFYESTAWSPDENFASINYNEQDGKFTWDTTDVFNLTSGEVIHANEEDSLYPFREISWSPDGAFFSFIKKIFTVVIQTNDLEGGEIILNQDFGIPPDNKLAWSPNGRFLMYGRQPNYLYFFDVVEKKHTKIFIQDLQDLDIKYSWWSSNSDGIFFIAKDSSSELHGVYWYAIGSKEPENIGDLIKLKFKPYSPNIEVKQSPDNQFSAIYILNTNEDGTRYYNYFLLDEGGLEVFPVKATNISYFSSSFIWVK